MGVPRVLVADLPPKVLLAYFLDDIILSVEDVEDDPWRLGLGLLDRLWLLFLLFLLGWRRSRNLERMIRQNGSVRVGSRLVLFGSGLGLARRSIAGILRDVGRLHRARRLAPISVGILRHLLALHTFSSTAYSLRQLLLLRLLSLDRLLRFLRPRCLAAQLLTCLLIRAQLLLIATFELAATNASFFVRSSASLRQAVSSSAPARSSARDRPYHLLTAH